MAQPQSLAEELDIPKQLLLMAAERAYDLLNAEQYDESLVMCEGLVVADESNAYYRVLLGTVLLKKRQLKKALVVVDEGLKRAPGNADLVTLRSTIAKGLGLR
jgi:predicted Zn-dependent protease